MFAKNEIIIGLQYNKIPVKMVAGENIVALASL